jgi:tetratricopeptide (TPR) repeat protein
MSLVRPALGWPRLVRALAAAALLLVAASAARADVEDERVRAGLAAYDRAEYERAVALMQRALAESLTREEKVAAWRALGASLVALDRPDEARHAFPRLLTIDPAIELDRRESPRVRAVFEEARAEVAQAGRAAPPAHRLVELVPALDPPSPRRATRWR